MADYKRRSKEHDVDGYFKGRRRRERYSRDFTTDFNTDIQPRQSEETRVYRREEEMLIAYENDPALIRRKAMYQAGVSVIQRKEQEKEQANILISKHTIFGFLDESALGRELLGLALENMCSFVETVIDELGSTDRDDVSFEIVRHADQGALKTITASADGVDLIVRLFDELTSGSINDDEQEQANRLMLAIANTLPVGQFPQSLSHIKIFPHKDIHGIGPGGPSISYAKPAGGGKIRVQMSFRFREFPEGRTLPQEAMYPEGILLDANEIVGIRMYDEGGGIIFRPAIFLVQCANKTDAHYMQLYAEAAVMGVTLGTSAVASGSIRGGLTLTQKILSILDKTATGLYITTRLVQENRGWIIAKFGNSGRKFIHYTELINNAMMIYGGVRLVTSLGKLVLNWRKAHNEFKKIYKNENQGFDKDQLKVLKELENQLDELSKSLDDIDDIVKQGIREAALRESGVKFLQKCINVLKRNKKLQPIEIKGLLKKTNKGLVIKSFPSDKMLWKLSESTKVEWAIYEYGNLKIIRSGTYDSVLFHADANTKFITHTHLRNPLPSLQDYKELLIMRSMGSKIDGIRIITKDGPAFYNLSILELMKSKGQLK